MIKLYRITIEEVEKYSEEYCRQHFPKRYERAQRFRFREDRLRSLGVYVLLKEVLGLSEADIQTGENGKPGAEKFPGEFGITHSGEYVILAVSDTPVGVDLEREDSRAGRNYEAVAKAVLTEDELAWMHAADGSEAIISRFLRLWTLKESVSKAIGLGLALSFKSFNVLPLFMGEPIELEGHTLYGMNADFPGYGFAVCSLDQPCRVEVENGVPVFQHLK